MGVKTLMIIILNLIEDHVKQITLKASGKGFLVFLWRWLKAKLTFRDLFIPHCPIEVKKWKIKKINFYD